MSVSSISQGIDFRGTIHFNSGSNHIIICDCFSLLVALLLC